MHTKSIAILLAAALVGCGGDDDKEASRSGGAAGTAAKASVKTSTAKQQYVTKAEAICGEANEKEVELGAEGPGWMYSEQFDDPEFIAGLTKIDRTALRSLKALEPPAEQTKSVEQLLASIDRMLDALDERVVDLRAGKDKRSAEQLREYNAGYTDLAIAAGSLGLNQCQGLVL